MCLVVAAEHHRRRVLPAVHLLPGAGAGLGPEAGAGGVYLGRVFCVGSCDGAFVLLQLSLWWMLRKV